MKEPEAYSHFNRPQIFVELYYGSLIAPFKNPLKEPDSNYQGPLSSSLARLREAGGPSLALLQGGTPVPRHGLG